MNASLPTRLPSTENTGDFSGLSSETNIKQLDGAGHKRFGPLLSEARAAISPQSGADQGVPADAHKLIQKIQSLPQGGKLLPLLEQAVDSAMTAGVDPQQVLDQISAGLETLTSGNQSEIAAIIVAAVQQVVNEKSGGVPPKTSAVIPSAIEGRAAKFGQAGTELPGRFPVSQAQALMAGVENSADRLPGEAATNLKSMSIDKALAQLQSLQAELKNRVLEKASTQPPVDSKVPLSELTPVPLKPPAQSAEMRSADLAALMAASFKRQTGDARPLQSEGAATRLDSVSATPAPLTSQVSGSGSALPTVSINAPFNQGNWDQALGERIQWMVGQKMQGAQIKLNPAHLGPMEVRIQVQNDQASIQFSSAHTVVREALEAALPRLRDMFEASGVELVDVDVSGQSFAEQQRAGKEGENRGGEVRFADEEGGADILMETPLAGSADSGILDLFA